MINLLKNLVAIKSDTEIGANDALRYCSSWLTSHAIPHQVLENEGRLMIHAEVGQGPTTIVWNGHVDVVPAKIEQFNPIIEGDRLYGRGSADMKAGVAAMMEAFRHISSIPKQLQQHVVLHIVTDEETGGHKTSGHLVETGHSGDFVICGEPTQLKLSVQSKGVLQIHITFLGKAAHGSRPWEGTNAIEASYIFYEKLMNLPFTKASNCYFEYPSINLAKIQAGDRYNVVPDHCEVGYDIRFIPGQRWEEILQQITNLALSINSKNIVKVYDKMSAIITSEDNNYIKSLSELTAKVTQKEAVLFGQHGAADTRFYVNTGAIAIEFGPSGDDWHGPNEYVLISSVEQYADILTKHALT
ncbi:M20 family metallopeptidase [Paenisporosarcina antarctica]|uniref:M20 family peptidase n=1 Tax=Paenisporosarcina antarctica TaxID=417367 RepID=A0A4P6ZV22_9BACL|nr:M20/M25/M40 family metallo-hydrolase [Paenisporosarcina antarctica]QBP40340.1 M20 family peptidase [Paenisporosarcina antarctica]